MRRILITLAALALFALAVPAAASAHHGHKARDRNRDGLPDRWERQHHLSLKVNQAHRDPDRDGLDNRAEFEHGTDPRRADTDRNGVRDDNEVRPVGTIASFNRQNGMLTIIAPQRAVGHGARHARDPDRVRERERVRERARRRGRPGCP
jgi:hypothetical protein